MRYIDWQIDRFGEGADRPAVIWHDQIFSYADLRAAYDGWVERLAGDGVRAGDAVGVVGDFSPSSIACLLALLKLRCIAVPLAWDSRDQHATFCEIAELDWLVTLDADDAATVAPQSFRRGHELMEKLRELDEPGLVLFSSGSTGKPKAILHNLQPLLDKFRKPRHSMRTVSFLLFDHIGGFNTLLYTLANLGTVVVPRDRSVAQVCDAVQKHRAQLLPTSPSFLNLLLLGEAHRNYDLSSLELVTYGTEVMPERTLVMLGEALPNARLQQTYGLSELGILRSKSASNQSLLVKVGGEDYETRVVDGTLHIRARSSMLGYLNAPSPFDADGWFNTGDAVIQEGEYYRILGRKSEIINVGGQKVYPAEVETVIAELPEVIDVAVKGTQHLLLGQTVVATVQMEDPIPSIEMKRRIVRHCTGRLQPYMIPTKVEVVTESPVNGRFKKVRR